MVVLIKRKVLDEETLTFGKWEMEDTFNSIKDAKIYLEQHSKVFDSYQTEVIPHSWTTVFFPHLSV